MFDEQDDIDNERRDRRENMIMFVLVIASIAAVIIQEGARAWVSLTS